jgi:hypothetical protein
MKRKCAFTNKSATKKSCVMPKGYLRDPHNWANKVPCNEEFDKMRKKRIPTELEMQAMEYFHMLEMAKIRVEYFERKLEQIQNKIIEECGEELEQNIKESDIDKAKKIKELDEAMEKFHQNMEEIDI